MGISTSAVLIYGLPYDEMREIYHTQYPEEDVDFYQWLEDNELDSASPYFDSDYSDRVFGININSSSYYTYEEISLSTVNDNLQNAIRYFSDIAGKRGKLYISPNVT